MPESLFTFGYWAPWMQKHIFPSVAVIFCCTIVFVSVEAVRRLFADLQLTGMPAMCSPVRHGLKISNCYPKHISGITDSSKCLSPEIFQFWSQNRRADFFSLWVMETCIVKWCQSLSSFPVLSLPNSHVSATVLQGRRPGCRVQLHWLAKGVAVMWVRASGKAVLGAAWF